VAVIDRSEDGYRYHLWPYATCRRRTSRIDEVFPLYGAPVCLAQIGRAGIDFAHIATHVMDFETDEYSGTEGLAFNARMQNPQEVFVWRWRIEYLDEEYDIYPDDEDDY
jgi:hypothetical protein